MFRTNRLVSAVALSLSTMLAGSALQAASFTIVDGEGFEAPAYSDTFLTTGQLEGQFAETDGGFGSTQWKQTVGGLSSAVVQTAVVSTGSQAVRVDRVANSDDRWAVPVSGYPAERFVCIEWDMRVEQSGAGANEFGPFFGVEAFDDDGAEVGLFGSLGVDSANGDVLFQSAGTGFFAETGAQATFGEWSSYRLILDFDTDSYSYYKDGSLLGTEGFVDNGLGLEQFTDANIAALAAAGGTSLGLTGTAYFDNFVVFETDVKIPEPASLSLLLAGLSLVATRRRR